MDDLMTTADLAAEVRAPVSTVRYWRHVNYGPKGIKVGKRVLYRRIDVEQWLEQLRNAAS